MSDSYLFIYFGKIDQIRTSNNAKETKKHIPAGEKHKQVTDRTSWNPLIEVFYCEDESSDQEAVVFLPEKNLLLFLFSLHRSSLRRSLLKDASLPLHFCPGQNGSNWPVDKLAGINGTPENIIEN